MKAQGGTYSLTTKGRNYYQKTFRSVAGRLLLKDVTVTGKILGELHKRKVVTADKLVSAVALVFGDSRR